MYPSVAIVILNWNGKKYLEQFLPSVCSTHYPQYRIIVADNASTDDSVVFLQEHYPQIEIIRLSWNQGYAKGYNEALQQVQADYYMLLNSDVEVQPGWLLPMVEWLEKDPSNAACQPKLLSYSDKSKFEYAGAAGGWIDAWGYPFNRGRVFDVCEDDHGQYDTIEEIFWATGAALLIKSRVFHELQGFDDYLFAHMEEIDLCWRAQLKGYKIFCHPHSVVYHVGGGTLPKGNSRKTFLNYRNNHIILFKNLPVSEKWWKIPWRMGLDQIGAVKMLFSGDFGYFRAVIRAHFAFLKWLFFKKKKPVNGKRRRIKSLKGVYKGNIVWAHFIKKKQSFSEIVGKQ